MSNITVEELIDKMIIISDYSKYNQCKTNIEIDNLYKKIKFHDLNRIEAIIMIGFNNIEYEIANIKKISDSKFYFEANLSVVLEIIKNKYLSVDKLKSIIDNKIKDFVVNIYIKEKISMKNELKTIAVDNMYYDIESGTTVYDTNHQALLNVVSKHIDSDNVLIEDNKITHYIINYKQEHNERVALLAAA